MEKFGFQRIHDAKRQIPKGKYQVPNSKAEIPNFKIQSIIEQRTGQLDHY
ncbi:MAG: hypothetical protein ACJAXB_002765 [Candidatus Endobugula sp.]|jgi:hypothetical protein